MLTSDSRQTADQANRLIRIDLGNQALHLIDSHIHLDFQAFDADRSELIHQAQSGGIKAFVVPATTRQAWSVIARLAHSYPDIFPAYGIHPYYVATHRLQDCDALDHWLASHRCVAVGEVGLDYYLTELDHDHQMQMFRAQLVLARQHTLPVILHARKAVDAVTIELKAARISQGIIHSFNGSYVQAMRLIDMGFKLGFGGAISYPRATRLRALIKQLPLESICLETDAPDQPVRNLAGQRNLPLALLDVLETVAQLRETTPEIIAQHSTHNTYAALNI